MSQERLTRFLLISLGYGLAVLVASSICVIILLGEDIFQGIGAPNFRSFFGILFLAGIPVTTLSAWPGFLLTLAAVRITGHSSLLYFTVCGAVTALLSIFVAAVTFWGEACYGLLMSPAIYVGGAAGGLAYGLFNNRFLANRRSYKNAKRDTLHASA